MRGGAVCGCGGSLGSKLLVLLGCDESAAAQGGEAREGQAVSRPAAYAGHVLVAFNNASAVDTVRPVGGGGVRGRTA
jgi:hypothetical protein